MTKFCLPKKVETTLRSWCGVWLICLITAVTTQAAPRTTIENDDFHQWLTSQQIELQKELEILFPAEEGFLVTGPLDPLLTTDPESSGIFGAVRVICPDLTSLRMALESADTTEYLSQLRENLDFARSGGLAGFRGVTAIAEKDDQQSAVLVMTVHQTRWLIWWHGVLDGKLPPGFQPMLENYAQAVSDYFYALDTHQQPATEPRAVEFELPASFDLFAPRPDYVIEGYQNYKNFLYDHEEIITDFARGIVAFIPTDSLLGELKGSPPPRAYFNKEQALLQYEYRKFFVRGGDVRTLRTLTAEVFAALTPGEYFYAVSPAGKIRFGREMLREEVARIEAETGKKVPRANHAFLFPGEPVLTAGAFFIEGHDQPRLRRVNAHSGHYFYSNVTATIREDIAEHSNEYLLSLGFFFAALDQIRIAYHAVQISKF